MIIKKLNESLIDDLNTLHYVGGVSKVSYELVKQYEGILNEFPVGTVLNHRTEAGTETFTKVDEIFWNHSTQYPPHTNKITALDTASWLAGRGNITRSDITQSMGEDMKITRLNESACWFGKYFDMNGKKKLVYISKDLTGDADEADNMIQDMIPEPFTKFIFGGSVDSRMAEAEGMTLLEKKLNESTNTTDEFYEIVDTVIGPAINSIGGDMDDITGDIAQTYDEDKFFVSLYSTVPRKFANKFSKNFLNTIQTALSKTRFSDVSLDPDRTFAYKLSRMDIHNHLGSERGDQFLSEFAMFEIGITAYGERLNEAMTIAYDKDTIKNMIERVQRNLEDYKSLLTEFPEDREYWKEMIRKCELEIAELESYDMEV